ncbi:MAG: PKD domain-containing protein, partial [Haliscomenobacter sp.]|nr:PKD domain-containing protein [Haliscomenobacter sp.]
MVRFWCAGILTFVLASQPIWGQNCDLPRVAAEFSLLKNDICEGQIINIDNTTLENGHTNIRYIMDWGDGIRDTVMGKQKMTHQYNLSSFDPCGEDNVQMEMKLIAIPLDCPSKQHNVTKPVFVTFKPRPDFSSKIEICIASPAVTFTNQSCPSQGLNYRWNFGDPASASNASAEKNPTHTFSGTGDFTVTLVDSNVCGADARSKNIRVVGLPKADFSFIVDPATACLPNPIGDFKNNSNQWSNTTWSITPNDTLKWRFTDTSMRFSSRDIRVRFIQAGQYTVRLTASNVCPQPNVQEEKIQIYAPPSISLQSPGAFCDSKTIRLADLGFKESGAITAYRWTFVNGTPSSAVGRDFPPVTFTQSGAIALLAESPCGNVADTVPILIASTMPVDISSNKTVYCQNEPPLTLSAIPTGGSWLINGRTNAAIDAQGVFQPGKLAPGKYALTYTAGTVQCPNEQDLDIEVKDSVSVALEGEPIACETLRYTP